MASSLNIQQILLSNTFDEFRISSNTVIDELNKFGTGSATVTVGSIVITTTDGESGDLTVGNDLDVTGESSFGGIGSNFVPSLGNTYDLGSGSENWKDLYIAGTANINVITATSGSTVNDFEVGGNLTVTGNATITGNLTFGDAETDTITLGADIASSILPETTATYNLGSLSKQWQDLYLAGTANVETMSANSGVVINDFTVDTTTFHVDSTTNRVGILNTNPDVSLDIGSATDAIHIPVGTTAQRPTSPDSGYFRYNTSLSQFEGYTSTWGAIGGGGTNTFTTDTYTGDGVETEFVLSQSTESESNLMVFVDGIFQNQDAYSISTTGGITTLIFSEAPANTRSIVVYVVAAGVSGNNLNQDSFAGDGILQVFTLSIPPVNENNTQVFIDGVYQQKDAYTINGYDIQFSEAPPSGTTIEVMTFTQTEVNVPANNTVVSASLAGDLVTPGSLTVTTDLIVTGDTTLNGNLYFGDANTDTITFAGEISSHILPSVDITYDLGSATNRWRDLYLSGNTIYIGDGKIEYNDTSNEFELKNSIDQTVKVSLSANTTTDLSEGSNKYYTSARVLTDGVGIVPAGSLRGTLSDVRMQYGVAYDSAAGAPQAGSFFFDSLNSKLKVHTGSTFIDAVPAGGGGGGGDTTAANATFRKYSYTTVSDTNIITGEEDPTTDSGNFVVGRTYKIVSLGTTDFAAEHPATAVNSVGDEFVAEVVGTGTGTASQVLEYIVDGSQNIEVYVNGVKQFEGATQDYVSTTGNSVNFTYTLPTGSNVDIQVYELLTNDAYYLKTETYTQSETNTQISTALSTYDDQANSDARYVNVTGDTMTGTLIVADSLNGDPVLAHFYNDDAGTLAESTVYISNNATTNGGLFLQATGSGFTTQDGFVQDAAVLGATSNASGGLSIMTRSNTDIRFYTNGHTNERARITNLGDFLVGTTSAFGTTGTTINKAGLVYSSADEDRSGHFDRTGVSDGEIVRFSKAGTTVGSIGTQAGEMNIGTTNCGLLFNAGTPIIIPTNVSTSAVADASIDLGYSAGRFKDIYTASAAGSILTLGSTNTSLTADQSVGHIHFTKADTSGAGAGVFGSVNMYSEDADGESSYMTFRVGTPTANNVERVRITSDGNVGIGTNSPASPLNIKKTGTVGAVQEFLRLENNALGGTNTGSSIDFYHYTDGSALNKAASIASLNTDSWPGGIPSSYSTGLTFSTLHENTFDERLRIDSSGNVGIGVSPTAKLDINISTNARGYFSSNIGEVGAGNFALQVVDATGLALKPLGLRAEDIRFATLGGERMRIDASGNVGIGVVPSASWAGNSVLQLSPKGSFTSSVSFGAGVSTNLVATTAGWDTKYLDAGAASAYLQATSDGSHRFYTAPVGTAGAVATIAERMRIDASGNVGIGTADPTTKLEVASSIARTDTVTPDTATVKFANNLNDGLAFGHYLSSPFGSWIQSGYLLDGHPTEWNGGYPISLNPEGGNVGIGVVPSAPLHIKSSTGNAIFLQENGSPTTGTGQVGRFVSTTSNVTDALDSNGYYRIGGSTNPATGAGFSEYMRIDSAGNVGIGGAATSFGAGVAVLQLTGTSSGNATRAGALRFKSQDGTSSVCDIYSDNGFMSFYTGTSTSTAERMRIDASGRVGIGGVPNTNWRNDLASQEVLMLGTEATLFSDGGVTTELWNNAYIDNTNVIFNISTRGASRYQQYDGTHKWWTAASASAGSDINTELGTTPKMTLDVSGNLLVGTTTDYAKLAVRTSGSTIQGLSVTGDTAGDTIYTIAQFGKFDNDTTTSQVFINFTINNGAVASGQINANGAGAVAFGSWSDRRLKENINDLPSQLANITALRPVEFDYIESEGGEHQIGFVAQEVEEIYPDLVGERQDGMKTLSGMGKMEARLIKAIQEQQATIEALTARIAALES